MRPDATKDIFSSNAKAQAVIHAELFFTSETDTDAVLDFYRGNRHQHVHIRDEALLSELVRTGNFLVLKDKQTGDILASSGTYAYRVTGDATQPSFKEIGSTRFSEKLAGFGLYPLFISSQVVHSMLTNPCKKMFIANVYDDSPVGRELLTKKAGWTVIEATPDIIEVFKATKDQQAAKDKNERPMTWYGSPPSCMPHQAMVVLNFIANKTIIQHKREDVVLHVDYSKFDLAQSYQPQLKILAGMAQSSRLSDGTEQSGELTVAKLSQYLNERAMVKGLCEQPPARQNYRPKI